MLLPYIKVKRDFCNEMCDTLNFGILKEISKYYNNLKYLEILEFSMVPKRRLT